MNEHRCNRSDYYYCFTEYGDGTACDKQAKYIASANWTAGIMLLCEDCLDKERAHDDVYWVRSIPVTADV